MVIGYAVRWGYGAVAQEEIFATKQQAKRFAETLYAAEIRGFRCYDDGRVPIKVDYRSGYDR